MDEGNKKQLFNQLLNRAEHTGIEDIQQNTLSKIYVDEPFADYWDRENNRCQTGYAFTSIKSEHVDGKLIIKPVCSLIQQPSGTPYDCRYVQKDAYYRSGGNWVEIQRMTCPSERPYAISGGCRSNESDDKCLFTVKFS